MKRKPDPQQGRLFGESTMKAAANGKPAPPDPEHAAAPAPAIAAAPEPVKRKRRARRYVAPAPDDLDDICRNNHGGEEHSEEANKLVTPHKRAQHVKIINYVRDLPEGFITDEIQDRLGFPAQTIYPRVSELKKDGTLVPVLDAEGNQKEKPTRNGGGAGMWRLRAGL
jgi:hypothetical protein